MWQGPCDTVTTRQTLVPVFGELTLPWKKQPSNKESLQENRVLSAEKEQYRGPHVYVSGRSPQ